MRVGLGLHSHMPAEDAEAATLGMVGTSLCFTMREIGAKEKGV